MNILVIAICAVIAGADDWEGVEAFGKAKREWCQIFLELPNGFPRMIRSRGCLLGWTRSNSRPAFYGGRRPAGSAWATANRLVLGQVKVREKSNEITAVPRLLEALEISGVIVAIEAMGCQTEIAQVIVAHDTDYVLALKDNQGQSCEDVELLFHDLENS